MTAKPKTSPVSIILGAILIFGVFFSYAVFIVGTFSMTGIFIDEVQGGIEHVYTGGGVTAVPNDPLSAGGFKTLWGIIIIFFLAVSFGMALLLMLIWNKLIIKVEKNEPKTN